MIRTNEQAREHEQRPNDYRNRFRCVLRHRRRGCNEISPASSCLVGTVRCGGLAYQLTPRDIPQVILSEAKDLANYSAQ
jgi:hypothetical protein